MFQFFRMLLQMIHKPVQIKAADRKHQRGRLGFPVRVLPFLIFGPGHIGNVAVARRIADLCTKEKRNRDENGRPLFDVKIYALRKDGAHGAASLYSGARYAVCDTTSDQPRLEPAAYLFEGRPKGW